MTGPLIVLGLLSAAGGVLNVPALLGGDEFLHHWLAPVTTASAHLRPAVELSRATMWTLIAIAVATGLGGIIGAVRLLDPAALVPAAQAPEERGLARVLLKKWYVDELYDAVFVRPIVWFSREVLWKIVDQRLVDGLAVNGTAVTARALARVGSRLQSGQVGWYVAFFVLGVVVILQVALR
jgi:NADH-quinone oxidoreductase subunit L